MLTLYFAPGASSMAPHIALHELAAPFDGKPVSLARKENRSAEFLAVNPEGTWMSFIAATVHPARRQGLDHAWKIYAIADARLGAREWVVGRYSVADIHLFRLFWRFNNSLKLPRAVRSRSNLQSATSCRARDFAQDAGCPARPSPPRNPSRSCLRRIRSRRRDSISPPVRCR